MRRFLACLALLTGAGLLAGPAAWAQKGDRYKITVEDIASKPDLKDAYDAVRQLRANWLRVRASGSVGATSGGAYSSGAREPAIYVDDIRMQGGVNELKNIRISEVVEMRWLSGTDALARYGNGHEYGAIFVSTTRRVR
jgi:hypothetical protein